MQKAIVISAEDLAAVEDLIACADVVVSSWEKGDLAGAVRELDGSLSKVKSQLGMDTESPDRCAVVCQRHSLMCDVSGEHAAHLHPINGYGPKAKHRFLDVIITEAPMKA